VVLGSRNYQKRLRLTSMPNRVDVTAHRKVQKIAEKDNLPNRSETDPIRARIY